MEETSSAIAFWSYAHKDDERVEGKIVQLVERVSREYALLTGYPQERSTDLFLDCRTIEWGEDWSQRIDQALTTAALLIPVLSPLYFARPECRRELEAFASDGQPAGRRESILPILYVPIPNFTADNPDRLVAAASRLRYEDWTGLRLRDFDSQESRQAVNRLARRLGQLISGRAARQELQRTLAAIEERLSGLREAAANLRVAVAQYQATREVFREERRERERTASSGPALDPLFRESAQLTPLEERCLAWADIQHARAAEMDPLVTRAVQLAEQDPDARPLLQPLEDSVHELAIHVVGPIGATAHEEARVNPRLKEVVRNLADLAPRTEVMIQSARTVMLGWNELLCRPPGAVTEGDKRP